MDSKINDGFSSQTLFHQVIPLVPTTVGTPPPSKGDFLASNPYLELMLTNQSIKEVEKMKNQVLILLLATLIIGGCTSSGAFLAANQTIVSLEDGNYSIAASNVMGESESAYILGLSYSTGLSASTLAIARVEGTGMLYAEALENLEQESRQGRARHKNVPKIVKSKREEAAKRSVGCFLREGSAAGRRPRGDS